MGKRYSKLNVLLFPMCACGLMMIETLFEQHCGECVKLKNSDGKSIVVRIIDQCPECTAPHLFDLSKDAFSEMAPLSKGVVKLEYEFVPCSFKSKIVYKVHDNSNKWWMSVVVQDHNVPVKKFELKGKTGDWVTVQRKDYNEFVYESGGSLEAPLSFRVTGTNGEVITDNDIVKSLYHLQWHFCVISKTIMNRQR